jgi:hypothetical protein
MYTHLVLSILAPTNGLEKEISTSVLQVSKIRISYSLWQGRFQEMGVGLYFFGPIGIYVTSRSAEIIDRVHYQSTGNIQDITTMVNLDEGSCDTLKCVENTISQFRETCGGW